MILKSYGKINWALAVYDRRPDGYHSIDSIMQKISLGDSVEIRETAGEMALELGGPQAAGVPGDGSNLAWRAAAAYREQGRCKANWRISLEKELPWGAGLGGGSADAAGVLRLLEDRYQALGESALMALAASLGADIPFLLSRHAAARCRGLGERVEGLSPAPAWPLLLVMGEERVSTSRAYGGARPRQAGSPRRQEAESRMDEIQAHLQAGRREALGGLLFNDLYPPARALAPEIPRRIELLYELGASLAAMTGSGAACFALFDDEAALARAAAACRERIPFVAPCYTLAEA